jgi:Flp pilus assembly protein TadD
MQRLIFATISIVLISGNVGANSVAHVISNSGQTKPKVTDLMKHGRELWNNKDIASALADYQQAATIEPNNARIQIGIGFLFTQQNRFPQAIALNLLLLNSKPCL